jgi:hypothetical protein
MIRSGIRADQQFVYFPFRLQPTLGLIGPAFVDGATWAPCLGRALKLPQSQRDREWAALTYGLGDGVRPVGDGGI